MQLLPPLIVAKLDANSDALLSLNKLMQTPFPISYY